MKAFGTISIDALIGETFSLRDVTSYDITLSRTTGTPPAQTTFRDTDTNFFEVIRGVISADGSSVAFSDFLLFKSATNQFGCNGDRCEFEQIRGVIPQNGGSTTVSYSTQASTLASLTATREVPASVPGPLPLFGAAAAFGYSRKLKKRIARSNALRVASAIN
jgi:hypothetical protein